MTDLNELLKDWKDKRLAYKETNRAAHEALLDGIVSEIGALKAHRVIGMLAPVPDDVLAAHAADLEAEIEAFVAENKVKRGPGRPPKTEAA